MKHPVAKLATVLFSLTLVSAFLLRDGAAVAGGDDKCTIAIKGDSPTAKACATGGRKDAKAIMKRMVKAANAKGGKFACDGCHKDLDSYELTPTATEQYKKLEAASGIK